MHAPGKGGRPGIRESRMRIELAPRHARVQDQSNYRGSYNQANTNRPFDAAPQTPEEIRNLENFGFSGRDPSRVGGESPYLNPPS